MGKGILRGAITVLGILFILIGISGLVLPFLQGILLILIGFYILSLEHDALRTHFERLERRHPTVHKYTKRLRQFFH